jgi:hypothetical protein
MSAALARLALLNDGLNFAYNGQGLALLGYLKNVCRQLMPNIVFKR